MYKENTKYLLSQWYYVYVMQQRFCCEKLRTKPGVSFISDECWYTNRTESAVTKVTLGPSSYARPMHGNPGRGLACTSTQISSAIGRVHNCWSFVAKIKPDGRWLTSSWSKVSSLAESSIFRWSQLRLLGYTYVRVRSISGFRGDRRDPDSPPFFPPQKLDGSIIHTLSPIVFSFPALLLNTAAASPSWGAKYWLHFLLLFCPQ